MVKSPVRFNEQEWSDSSDSWAWGSFSHGSLKLTTQLPVPPRSRRLSPQQAQLVPAPAWELIPRLADARYHAKGSQGIAPIHACCFRTRAGTSSRSVALGQQHSKLPKLYLPELRRQGSQSEGGLKLVSLFCQASWTVQHLMQANPRVRLSQEKNSINVKMWKALEMFCIPVEEMWSTVTRRKAL